MPWTAVDFLAVAAMINRWIFGFGFVWFGFTELVLNSERKIQNLHIEISVPQKRSKQNTDISQ